MRRFLTRQWVWLHIMVAVFVPGFIALGWWQVIRAGAGNARSYGYAVEWPSMALIAIVLYVRAIRLELRGERTPVHEPAVTLDQDYEAAPIIEDADDPELAAYNRYLRDLHQRHVQQRR